MCKQFIVISVEDLDRLMNEVRVKTYVNTHPDWPARSRTVFPKAVVPVLVPQDGRLVVSQKTWGYPVSWSKSPIFNTRHDSLHKDIWNESIQERRCIIPSLGFFEPHQSKTITSERTGKQIKQNFLFEMPDKSPLFIAGIYQEDHFSMLTTEPNDVVKPIHSRMPLVLRQSEIDAWLHPNYKDLFDRSGFELICHNC